MTQAGPQPEPQGKPALHVRTFTGSKRFQHETGVALSSLAERRTARFTRPQKHIAGPCKSEYAFSRGLRRGDFVCLGGGVGMNLGESFFSQPASEVGCSSIYPTAL